MSALVKLDKFKPSYLKVTFWMEKQLLITYKKKLKNEK